MNDDREENFFPSNSTLNASIQPERVADLQPQSMGSPAPPPPTPKQGKYTCNVCGAEFSDHENLRIHLKKSHSKENIS